MMFVSLELQSFGLYILVGIQQKRIISTETSIKYYILGGISSSIILFGSSIIYGFTTFINFNDIALYLSTSSEINYPVLLGLFLISLGFLFKLGVAPFHVWVPEVYQNAPS